MTITSDEVAYYVREKTFELRRKETREKEKERERNLSSADKQTEISWYFSFYQYNKHVYEHYETYITVSQSPIVIDIRECVLSVFLNVT